MKTTLLFLSVFLSTCLFGQNVFVPDDQFESYLESNGMGNGILNDDSVSLSNINGVTDLILNDLGILDLTGIEMFSSLEFLEIESAGITSIDVSNNLFLRKLILTDNELTSIDVSNNINLEWLQMDFNSISQIDLSNNINLTRFTCQYNDFVELNLSSLINIEELYCSVNPYLTCLNIRNGNGTALSAFNAIECPNLFCIEVDDVTWANATWVNSEIDPQVSFSEDCNNACSNSTSQVTELTTCKNLIQILDMMGRETTFKPNTALIYVYDDGSTEKVFTIE